MHDSRPNEDHLNENKQMYVNIRKIFERCSAKQKVLLEEFGITHSQYNILRILRGVYPSALSVKEILKRMIVGSPDVTRMVDRLCSKKLVQRAPNEDDKRKMDISISLTGVNLLVELNPKMEQTVNNFFINEVPLDEARKMNQTLNKMLETLEEVSS